MSFIQRTTGHGSCSLHVGSGLFGRGKFLSSSDRTRRRVHSHLISMSCLLGAIGRTLDCDDASEADARPLRCSLRASPGKGALGRDYECACRARRALASSASNSSGGRRLFSISDFRLGGDERSSLGKKRETYASSNPEMASLMPSVPNARVPYSNLADPVMLFNSPTFPTLLC
jgi:hypothetical protein